MTKQNDRKRYEALGFNVSLWARYCGVVCQSDKDVASGGIYETATFISV